MTFTVTYRDKGGGVSRECIEAVNKTEAFAILGSRGIVVLSLTEGRSGNDYSRKEKKSSIVKLCATALVILTVFLLLIFTLCNLKSQEEPSIHKTDSVKIETHLNTGTTAPKGRQVPAKSVSSNQPKSENLYSNKVSVVKNHFDIDSYVSKDPAFKDRYERFQKEQAALPFKHISENEIAQIIFTSPGQTFLATEFHPQFERDFVDSLNDPIVVAETDSEEVKYQKETMKSVKAELKLRMDKGESIRDLLKEEQKHLLKIASLRENLYRELKEIEKSAKSTDELNDFVSAANQMLDEYGATHIKLPISRERYRLEKAEGRK